MTNSYQNKVYRSSNYIKFYYLEIFKHASKCFKYKDKIDILDLGCASGDLVIFLSKKFSNSKITGIDTDVKNINFGKKKIKSRKLEKRINLLNYNFTKFPTNKKFDLIIASGFLCFFDDFKKPLNKMIKLLKNKNSKIIIFGDFNSSGIDKIVKFRNVNNKKINYWLEGLTSFSIKTLQDYLTKKKYKLYKTKFNLPKDIGSFNNNPIRSISRILKGYGRIIFNRVNLIFEFHTLTISKK